MAATEVEHFLSYLRHLQQDEPGLGAEEVWYQAAKYAHDWHAPEEDIDKTIYDH